MEKTTQLKMVQDEVESCTKCPELVANRIKTVFGEGNPNTELVIIGEGPGFNESKEGRPFVGEAGKLLNNIIIACKWKREDLYILNVVKCHPPKNRVPGFDEQHNCRPFLERQLEIINPKYLLLLGATASEAIFQMPFSMVRGTLGNVKGGRIALSTYHPAYLLRNPDAKGMVWSHLQKLLEIMKN